MSLDEKLRALSTGGQARLATASRARCVRAPRLPGVADARVRPQGDPGGAEANGTDTPTWAIPSLGLNEFSYWNEASHGMTGAKGTQPATNFALPLTIAQAFNRTLWHANGAQIGREARAAMNAGLAFSTFWAPVVNLASEPRWGRNLETSGEDPYLAAQYAEAFVTGMQEVPEAPGTMLASACCKHYVANQLEGSTVNGVRHTRHEFDARVSPRDMVDSYLPPFQACVERGHVAGLMCSYNAVNGVPTCADDWLLRTIARGEWGFDGYITSDCGASADVFESHHFTATAEEAVGKILGAGTDLDCGNFVVQHVRSALASGFVTEAQIDTALQHALSVRMRMGNFDRSANALDALTPDNAMCTPAARALGRDGAAQSVVLVKNWPADGGEGELPRLPLDAANVGTIAVIGPNANLSLTLAGYYGPANACPDGDGRRWPNLVDAIGTYAPRVVTALGIPSALSNDTSGIAAAAQLVRDAHASLVVAVLGSDLSLAREGDDATSLALPPPQLALVDRLAAAAPSPLVVVLLTATPLDVSRLLSDPRIGAVIHAGFPSVQVGGVADVLFGAVAPAGRLVQTIYPAAFADEVSIFDQQLRPGPSDWPAPGCAAPPCPNGTNPGRTHRFYTGTPVLPFGFGLSYTTFMYELLEQSYVEEPLAATPHQPSNAPRRAVPIDRVVQMLEATEQVGVRRARACARGLHHACACACEDVQRPPHTAHSGPSLF